MKLRLSRARARRPLLSRSRSKPTKHDTDETRRLVCHNADVRASRRARVFRRRRGRSLRPAPPVALSLSQVRVATCVFNAGHALGALHHHFGNRVMTKEPFRSVAYQARARDVAMTSR